MPVEWHLRSRPGWGVRMPRILVIEDDPRMRLQLNRGLGGAGHDVVECATATTGLAATLAEDFDLVLLDLTLPDVAG